MRDIQWDVVIIWVGVLYFCYLCWHGVYVVVVR